MHKRQLNWKLLTWIVGAAVVSAGAVHFAHSAQMKRHARTLLGQAVQAAADGKLDDEVEYLKRYLTFNRNDTDALARYGFALDKTATTDMGRARAAVVFEKVLAKDRKRADVRQRVIEIYLDLSRFTTKEAGWSAEACRHAELLAEARPDDADVFVLLGRCQEHDEKPEEARASYAQAIKKDPRHVEAALRLAYLLRGRELAGEGEAVLTALVRANDTAPAYLERALYRLSGGKLKEAGEDLAEAHKRDAKDPRVLLALADLAQRQGNIEDARKWWKIGVTVHGDDAVLHAGLAALELQQKRAQAALDIVKEALKRHPTDPELHYLLNEAYLQQNDVTAATKVIEELRARGGLTSLANFLNARLLLHQRRPLEAARELEDTLKQSALAPGLGAHICLCMGEAYSQIGNGDRALAAYFKAVELAPGLVRARVRLGAALLATGATDSAVSQLSEATRLPLPPDEAWTLLARALLQHTLTLPPDRRDWKKVEAALDRAAANASQAVPAALLRAHLLLARGTAADADAVLAKACADWPKQVELWTARAGMAARAGQPKRAVQILDEARARLGDSAELRLAALECWSGAEEAQALNFLRTQEAGLERFSTADRARVEAALAALHYRLGHSTEGDRLSRRLLAGLGEERRSAGFADWVQLLDLALQGRDDGLLDDVVRGLKKLEGEDNGVWWRYAAAARRVVKAVRGDRSGLVEARATLEKVTALRPGWGRAALLQAFLQDVSGDAARALEGYRVAFDLGERRLEVVQRLVALLAERGRFVEADEVLRQAQQQVIPRGEFARSGAEIALQARSFDRAIVLARLAVPEDTTDPARVIWLGQVLAAAGQGPQAEALFRSVAERAWDAEKKVWRYDPLDAWLILIAQLARANRAQEADDAIEQMRKQLPPERHAFALAVCYESLGRMEQAEENYRAALVQRKNESLLMQRLASLYIRLDRADQAEPLLVQMLGVRVVTPEANAAWARRELALICADRGGDKNYRAALALLEENRRNGRASNADARALAFVRATRTDSRAAALKELEDGRAVQPLEPSELFRLARLYEASEADWPRARSLMDELVKLDALNPEYLAHHVANLLKHGIRMEARTLVERLARLEGESERVRRFRGELPKAGP